MPYDAFEAKDGYFVGGATNDHQFVKLAGILGKPELAEDPRFSTNTKRVQHRDEISKIVNELFKKKTIEEWNEAFESSGMPYGGVNSMERVFKHPQSKARNMVVEMPHEAATKGTMSVIGMKLCILCHASPLTESQAPQSNGVARRLRSVPSLLYMESIRMRFSLSLV